MRSFLAALIVASLARAASAQIDMPAPMPMVNAAFQAQMFRNVLDSNQRASSSTSNTGRVTSGASARGRVPSAAPVASYRPDVSVRERVKARFLQEARRRDPAGAEAIARSLEKDDWIAMFDRAMSGYGLRSGNTIDALTAYWLASWAATANYDGKVTRQQVQAVRSQIAGGFEVTNSGLDTPAKRQEFAESLILQTVLIDGMMETAKHRGDRDFIRKMGEATHQAMLKGGVDLKSLILTDRGFVRRG